MALKNQKQVEAFADNITACADDIHGRLIEAIKDNKIDQITAQQIFQNEASLRQHANTLYIDAANFVVDGLGESHTSLIDLIGSARESIRTMEKMAGTIGLIANLILLAAAACTAKPGPILSAMKSVQSDILALNNSREPLSDGIDDLAGDSSANHTAIIRT